MIAYYKLDGEAKDYSGRGNDGAVGDSVQFVPDRFGVAGKASSHRYLGYFYPSTPNIDLIKIDASDSMKFTNGISGSFWSNSGILGGDLLSFFTSTPSNILDIGSHPDNNFEPQIVFDHHGSAFYAKASTDYTFNTWHHVGFSIDSNNIKIFIDGVKAIEQTYNKGNILLNTQLNLNIGNMKSTLDDIILFNGYLTDNDFYYLYNIEG